MSNEKTPVEWEPTKTDSQVVEPNNPTVEDETTDPNKSKKSSELEQQIAARAKYQNENKSLKEKLSAYEKAEEEKRLAKLEEEKKFEELKAEWWTTKESLSTENDTYKTELEKLRAENQAFLDEKFQSAMSKVPEDKREQVESIVTAYEWKQKVDKIEELVSVFWNIAPTASKTPDFGKTKSPSEMADLEAEIKEKWFLPPAKAARFAELGKA